MSPRICLSLLLPGAQAALQIEEIFFSRDVTQAMKILFAARARSLVTQPDNVGTDSALSSLVML